MPLPAREDALALFGFQTAEEKSMFEKLISISGIGPKLAITVLSGLATASLISAIRNGEVAQLVRIPGVEELNIGHSIVSRAVLVGMDRAVREMKEAMMAHFPFPRKD